MTCLNRRIMMMKLDTIVIETKSDPQFAVIWLHGLGADGNDFVPVIEAMNLTRVPGIRFIFPHAPTRPITINGGMVMRGWYDIAEASLAERQDSEGIIESAGLIDQLIDEQIAAGISANKIFIAGFSQGGAIAFYTGLSSEHQLAGIIALSTYVPIAQDIAIKHRPDVFYAHGEHDPIIPLALAKQSHEWLLENNIIPSWHQYPMQHQVAMEEITQINQWLISRINDITKS